MHQAPGMTFITYLLLITFLHDVFSLTNLSGNVHKQNNIYFIKETHFQGQLYNIYICC